MLNPNINMTENSSPVPAYGKESLSLMKQWILAKLQLPASSTDKDMIGTSGLPKIIISRGSDKSLHNIANSPLSRRPSPLARTWLNYNSETGSNESTPTSPHYPYTPKMPLRSASPLSLANGQRRAFSLKSESYPATPIESNFSKYTRANTTEGAIGRNTSSPVFRFSIKQKRLADLDFPSPSSNACSSSELDSHSVCGSCGQRKYFGSRDFVGFRSQENRYDSALTLKGFQDETQHNNKLYLRRTSSCRVSSSEPPPETRNMIKARSNFDIQRKSEQAKWKKIKRTGSRERSRSAISLTRAWSLNLDPIKLIRTTNAPKDNKYDRKMSLNDSELRRVSERRRSSLLRFCIEQGSCEGNEDSEGTRTIRSSVDDIDYSPKVTRSAIFKYDKNSGDPIEDFRSTFESENIKIPSVYGQIKVMFQFFNEKNELHVTLLKGANLARGCEGTLGVYVKLCLIPGKQQIQVCNDKHNTANPVFYEQFGFKVTLDQLLESQLRIKFYNKPGIFSRSKPIGECYIPLYYYDLTAVTVIWQNLLKSKGQKDDLDDFDFGPIEQHYKPQRRFSKLLCGLGRKKRYIRRQSNVDEPAELVM